MEITQAEDRLLFFLCTGLDLKQLIDALRDKYAYALQCNLGGEILGSLKDQISLLETSRNACTIAANFLFRFDKVSLN
jgi:hypothetical protein